MTDTDFNSPGCRVIMISSSTCSDAADGSGDSPNLAACQVFRFVLFRAGSLTLSYCTQLNSCFCSACSCFFAVFACFARPCRVASGCSAWGLCAALLPGRARGHRRRLLGVPTSVACLRPNPIVRHFDCRAVIMMGQVGY